MLRLLLLFLFCCTWSIQAQVIKIVLAPGAKNHHLVVNDFVVGVSGITADTASDLPSGFQVAHDSPIDQLSMEMAVQDWIDTLTFSNQSPTHELKLRIFTRTSASHKQLELTLGDSSCTCPQPAYCARDCWCDDGSCHDNPSPTTTDASHVIVHHTAGYTNSDDFPGVVKYYWDFHVNTNGWDDIGYNWLIDGNGVIYEGRGEGAQGAHFSCMNGATTGIAIIGHYENELPTDTALGSLKALIAWEACRRNIPVDEMYWHASSDMELYGISSHRDGNSASGGCPKGTTCPGQRLYDELGPIRTDVRVKDCVVINGVESTALIEIVQPQLFDLLGRPIEHRVSVGLYIEFDGQHFTKRFLTNY